MTELAIRTRGLSRSFGSLLAVDRVSLEIHKAHIFGFLGPNGSGKTTTLRMLCGLLEPSAGEAQVLGLTIPREAERLRQRIGYMTQRFSLYEELSANENLEFMGRIYSVPRKKRRRRISELIDRFDLASLRDQRAGTMSGGQRQRLALAAAVLHEPELLFLDEPTSAVDPESRRDFWESLFDLADGGTTILVSTHYMDEAERCHQLAILDHGAVAASGTPTELKNNIPSTVVEIEAENLRAIKHALASLPEVKSQTQLGNRLHVLVASDVDVPDQRLMRHLDEQGLAAIVRRVPASLEDVFVAATP